MNMESMELKTNIDPTLIGKDDIFRSLVSSLEHASRGKGSFILLEGEAGIGKTQVIDILEKESLSRGFRVMRGNCLDYRRSPYLPFKHMLMDLFSITSLGTYEKNREKVIEHLENLSLLEKDFQEDFTDLFIPKDEPVGGYFLEGERLTELLSYLKRSGYRIVLLTDREDLDVDKQDRSVEVIRIGGESASAVPPGRLERIATLMKGAFHRYRHCAVINDSMPALMEKNPEKKLISFLKIMNGLSSASDSAVIHIKRDESGHLLEDLKDIGDRLRDEKKKDPKERDMRMTRNDILKEFIFRLSKEEPLLLILEDLQWSDKHSLNLMQLLGRDISKESVLIVGSYRPEESFLEDEEVEVATLRDALQRMSREKLFTTLTLERLDKDQQRELVHEITGQVIDDDLVDTIDERSKGNPLSIRQFIEEISRNGKETLKGEVVKDEGEKDSVTRRISTLDDETMSMLEFASVLGESSSLKMIIEGLKIDEEEGLDRLERILKLKLIKEFEDILSFDKPATRDLVYNGIDDNKRKDLHIKAAELMESDIKDDGERKQEALGDHYRKGGDPERAYRAYSRAAEIEIDRMKIHRAEEILEKALSSIRALPKTRENIYHRVKTLQMIGDIKEQRGDLEGSLKAMKEAVELAEAGNVPQGISSSYRRIGDIMLKMFEWDRTVDYYLRSLHLSKKEDDQGEVSRAFKGLGTIYFLKGDYSRSIDCYLKYMESPRKEKRSREILTLLEIGDIYFEMGDLNQSLAYYNMAVRKGEESDLGIESALSYVKKANLLVKLGEVEDATRFGTWGYNMIKENYDSEISERVLLGFMDLMIETSNIPRADEAYEVIRTNRSKDTDDLLLKGNRFRTLALLFAKKGDFQTATDNLERALRVHESLKVPFQIGLTRFQMGLLNFQKMDLEEALENLEKASGIFKEINAMYYLNRTSSKIKEIEFINEGFGE